MTHYIIDNVILTSVGTLWISNHLFIFNYMKAFKYKIENILQFILKHLCIVGCILFTMPCLLVTNQY